MPKYESSNITVPDGPLVPGGGAGTSDMIALSALWRPEKKAHPAVGPSAPVTADGGIVSGDVSVTTGLKFIAWNDVDPITSQPYFNYQGMVPAPAPAGIQSSAGRSALLNAATPRWYNGNTGQYRNGRQDIRVGIASTRVIPVWYCGQGQFNTSVLDMHVMVEHDGENKHLSSTSGGTDGLPARLGSGAGSDIYRRELTHSRVEFKEHRFLLGGNCYFLGMWVDTAAIVVRPDNKPLLFVHGTDSWDDDHAWYGEGAGYQGDYQCLPMCTMASFHTGGCHASDGQGGTGEYSPNGTSGGEASDYNGNRSSAAWSDSRVNWRRDWWSSQYPIFVDIGGWNDGNSMVSPVQTTYRTRIAARVQKTIDRIVAAGRETRFINVGVQPVNLGTPSSSSDKWAASLGQAEVPALFPGVVLGHVSLMPMWYPDTAIAARDPYTVSADSVRIHLNRAGDDAVNGYIFDRAGQFRIDLAYLAKTAAANVPVVNVPTS